MGMSEYGEVMEKIGRLEQRLDQLASETLPQRGGVYSDVDIAEALASGDIEIEPEIRDEQIQPASLDVRMGGKLIDAATGRHIDPIGNTHAVYPWRLYRAPMVDNLTISNNLTAQIAGRSSFAREGLVVHLTAGWVDPGWSGVLTMEMVNFGPKPIQVDIGERVAQLIFQETKSESSGYEGKYQGATESEGSKR